MRRIAPFCLLVMLATIAMAAPAGATTDAFAVHYEGSYTWHQDWEGGGRSAGSYLRTNQTLSWVLDASGSKSGPGEATDVHVKLAAQGTLEQQGSDPNANERCTMTQAEGAGAGDVTVIRNSDGRLNVGLGLPDSVGGDLTVTGNHQNCDEFAGTALLCTPSSCAGATVCGAVPPVFHDTSFGDAFTPTLDGALDTSKPFDVGGPRASETVACNTGGTESTQIAITSSVRVNGGGLATHHPPGGKHIPEIERQKAFAKSDLLSTLFRAEAACGVVVLGTTAAVWGVAVPVVTAATAAIAGDIILLGSGPLCATLLDRLTDDARIINDPPLGDFGKVARPRPLRTGVALPACSKEPPGPAGFCDALRKRELAYVAAARAATAEDDALRITVFRESGAAKAGRAAALRKQERVATGLVAGLRNASRAERAAGAKVAALLRAQHVTGALTAEQAQGGVGRILTTLKTRHVDISKFPAGSLTAKPIDLVAAFTH